MALFRLPKLQRIASKIDNLREGFSRKAARSGSRSKNRRLKIDPLEERQLLSVSPADFGDKLINQTVSSDLQVTLAAQSLAADDDGDFVAVWTRYDQVLDQLGNPVTDPATGQPMLDANIYARYFTDEVQRITLPSSLVSDTVANQYGSFTLTYGGNEVQKLSFSSTYEPYTSPFFQDTISADFRITFPGLGTTQTIFYNELNSFEQTALDIQVQLQGLGGALADAQVQALNPHEYLINFGNASSGLDQPELVIDPSNITFNSGFLPSITVETIREPITVGPILVSPDNPADTVTSIEEAFLLTSVTKAIGPVDFPPPNRLPVGSFPNDIGPYPEPNSLRSGAPGVTVQAISTTEFDITFDGGRASWESFYRTTADPVQSPDPLVILEGDAGKTDHPLLVVDTAMDELGNPVAPGDFGLRTIKEPSQEFRVNPAEVDNPFTSTPDRFNQTKPSVAMDADGEFVIAWESEIPNSANPGSIMDVFARRFTAAGLVDPGDVDFLVDTDLDGVAEDPVQGVRALVSPQTLYSQRLIFDATGAPPLVGEFQFQIDGEQSEAIEFRNTQLLKFGTNTMPVQGTFRLTIDGTPTANINFNSQDVAGTRDAIQAAVRALGTPATQNAVVTIAQGTSPIQFNIDFGLEDTGGLISYAAVTLPLAATVSVSPVAIQNVAANIQNEMENLGYRDVTVTIVSSTDPYRFDVQFRTTFDSPVGPSEATARTEIQLLPGALPAIVSVTNQSPADLLTFRVNTDTTNSQGQPSVGMDDVGNFVIAWGSGGQDVSYFNGVRAQWYDRDGEPLGQEINVNTPDTSVHFDPYVAMSYDGHTVIAWTSTDTPTVTIGGSIVGTVNAEVYAPDRSVIRPQFSVGGVANPSASFDRDNNYYISWHEGAGGQNIGGNSSDVFAIAFTIDGAIYRDEFRVNSGSFNTGAASTWPLQQFSSQIVPDVDGDIVVSFEGFGPDVATAGFGFTQMDTSYFAAALADPANADLAALFPGGISFFNNLDLDASLEDVLIDVYNTFNADAVVDPLEQEQLGRLRQLIDEQLSLLRGDPNAAMTTRYDAAPGDPQNVLYSDNVQNAERSGHNQRYIIQVSTDTTGGNFVLRLFHPNLGGFEDLTINAPITGGSLNVGNLREAIEDALQGATRTGNNWTYTGSDPNNTVVVRTLQTGFGFISAEIARRIGTPWEVFDALPNEAIFEVTFQGEVHDTQMSMFLQNNNLTAQNVSEVQNLFFFSAVPGYYALQVGTTGPTVDLFFDPGAPGFPTTAAQQIENALVAIGFGGVTVTAIPGGPPYQFTVVFGGASAGVNQPPIQAVPISNPALPSYGPGNIFSSTLQNGGGSDAPAPDVFSYMVADDGITQTGVSLAVEPDGDYVMAWTQFEEYTNTASSNQNIYFRRFVESTDTAGPQVTDVFAHAGMHVDENDVVDSPVTHLTMTFDENMMRAGVDAITNPDNYILYKDGVPLPGGIAAIQFGMNKAADLFGLVDPLFTSAPTLYDVYATPTNKWEAVFTLDGNGDDPGIGPLDPGIYTIEAIAAVDATPGNPAVTGLRDKVGNPLGFNGFTGAGVDFSRTFVVPVAQRGDTNVIPGARTYPESAQAVASDADGDHVIVTTAVDTVLGLDRTYVRLMNADGSPSATAPVAFQVTPTVDFPEFAGDSQRYGTVAMDKDGDLIVTWTNYRGGEQDVYARRYSATGVPLGAPFMVNTFSFGEQRLSSVAMDVDGDFVITWSSNGQESATSGTPGLGYGIYARAYDSAGDPLGQEFLVNQTTPGNQRDSAVAMDALGNFAIAWASDTTGDDDVYVRTFLLDGTPTSAETLVNTTQVGNQNFPDVAMSLSGLSYVVTWTSNSDQDGSGLGVFARGFGGAATGEFQVNTSVVGDQAYSSVAMNHPGDFVITWSGPGNQPFQEDEGPVDISGVFYQRYDLDPVLGVTPSAGEIRANTKTENIQQYSSVASDGEGNFMVVWTGWTTDGMGNSTTDVFRFLSTDRLPVPDTVGPIVTDVVLTDRTQVRDGDIIAPPPGGLTQIVVIFGENLSVFNGAIGLDSVLNPNNWMLQRNGSQLIGGITSVSFGLNPLTHKYEALLNLDGNGLSPGVPALPQGTYTLTARSPITDGLNQLDGDFDAISGEDYNITFTLLGSSIDPPVGPGPGTVDDRTFAEAAQAVAVDADGDHVITWTAYDPTLGRDRVFWRIYNADGTAAGSPPAALQITPVGDFPEFLSDDQRYATVAIDKDGDFVITWTNYRDGDSDIYARRYQANGTPIGDPFLVNTFGVLDANPNTPLTNQKWSHVAMDADGDFIITWASRDQETGGTPGAGYGIYARRFDGLVSFDALGDPLPPVALEGEFRVNVTTVGNQKYPSVAMDALGGFTIAWTSDQGTNGENIIARVYNGDGSVAAPATPLTGEIIVNTTLPGNQRLPNVSTNLSGDTIVVTWTASGQDGSGDGVYARILDRAGAGAPEFQVNTTTLGNQMYSSVAMDHQGEFVVTWSGYGDQPGQQDTLGVFYQRYAADGTQVGSETRLNGETTGTQWLSSVASDGEGNFVAVWTGDIPAGTTNVFSYVSVVRVGPTFDNDGPLVTDVLNPFDRTRIFDGDVIVPPPGGPGLSQLIVAFGEQLSVSGGPAGLNSVLNPQNWTLTRNGTQITSGINSVAFVKNALSRKWEATVALDGNGPSAGITPLTPGDYELTVRDLINDTLLNPLNGDFDNTNGGDYTIRFSVSADATLDGEVRVNEPTVYEQRFAAARGTGYGLEETTRSLAVDNDGDYVVAWTSYGQDDPSDTDGAGVFYRLYDRDGNPLTGERRANVVTTGDQRDASVAVDADGDFVIAWEGVGAGGSLDVFARRFDSLGNPVLSDTNGNGIIDEVVDANGDGFIDLNNPAESSPDMVDVNGDGLIDLSDPAEAAPEFLVNVETVGGIGNQLNPAVAMSYSGDFAVVWVTASADFHFYNDIRGQLYSRSGTRVGNEFLVNTTNLAGTPMQINPAISMDRAGNFVAAWEELDTQVNGVVTNSIITARQFTLTGLGGAEFRGDTGVGSGGLPNDEVARVARNPQLASDENGGFLLVWEAFVAGNADYDVFFRQFDSAGTPGAGGQVNQTQFTGEQVNPSADIDAEGSFVIVFNGNGGQTDPLNPADPNLWGDLDDEGVFIRSYDPTSTVISVQSRVNRTQAGIQQFPSVGVDRNGDTIVVWNGRGVGDQHGIFSRRYEQPNDRIGPLVTEVRSQNGTLISEPIESTQFLVVTFDENMWTATDAELANALAARDAAVAAGNPVPTSVQQVLDSVTNPENWSLSRTGVEIPGAVVNVEFGLSEGAANLGAFPATNKYEAVITVDADPSTPALDPLPAGTYSLTARRPITDDPTTTTVDEGRSGLRDAVGNPLLSTITLPGGADFTTSFTVVRSGVDTPVTGGNDVSNGRLYVESPGAVAVDADGDHIVVWTAYDASLGRDRVFFRVYDADGSPADLDLNDNGMIDLGEVDNAPVLQVTPAADFPAFADVDQRHPTVAVDLDGDFVVSWTQYDQDGTGSNIYARRFRADLKSIEEAGQGQGNQAQPQADDPFRVNTYLTNNQKWSDVALDADGDLIVVWSSYSQADGNQLGTGYDLYARRFTSFGTAIGPEFSPTVTHAGDQMFPSVTMDTDGGFVIAWQSDQTPQELANIGQFGSGWDIYVRSFFPDGTPQSLITSAQQGFLFGEILVNETTNGDQTHPDVDMSLDGSNFVVTWSGPDASGQGVYARQFTRDPDRFPLTALRREYEVAVPLGGFPIFSSPIYPYSDPANGVTATFDPALSELRVNFTITDTFNIDDLESLLDISHVRDSDLIMALEHNGVQVVLSDRNPRDASGTPLTEFNPIVTNTTPLSNFLATIFDDEATTSITAYPDAQPPFTGRFIPQDLLSQFDTQSVSGTWTLVIVDAEPAPYDVDRDTATDTDRIPSTGFLTGWSLDVLPVDTTIGAAGPEFRVNMTTNGTQFGSSVAVDYNGSFVVTWGGRGEQPFQQDDQGVFFQRYSSNATQVGSETRVNLQTSDLQSAPSVDMDGSGNFVVTWMARDPVNNTSFVFKEESSAFVSVPDTDGPVATELQTASGRRVLDGDALIPADGAIQTLRVVFSEDLSDFLVDLPGTTVNEQLESVLNPNNWSISRNGQTLVGGIAGIQFFTPAQTGTRKYEAVVTLDGDFINDGLQPLADGDYTLALFSEIVDAHGTNVPGNPLDGDVDGQPGTSTAVSGVSGTVPEGAIFRFVVGADASNGAEFRINQDTSPVTQQRFATGYGTGFGLEETSQTVAVDNDGDFVVAWTAYGPDGAGDVYIRLYNRNNVPLTGDLRVHPYTAGNQRNPSVAMDADGDFIVTWEEVVEDGDGNLIDSDVYARRFDARGNALVSDVNHNSQIDAGDDNLPFRVNTETNGIQFNPAVAMDDFGNSVIVWGSMAGQPYSYFNRNIFGQIYDAKGRADSLEFQVNELDLPGTNADPGSLELNPTVAYAQDGSYFIAAWERIDAQRNGVPSETDIKARIFEPDGTPSLKNSVLAAGGTDGEWLASDPTAPAQGVVDPTHTPTEDAGGGGDLVNRRARNPQMSFDSQGNFILVWEAYQDNDINTSAGAESYGIYYLRYAYDSTTDTVDRDVDMTSIHQANLVITSNLAGAAHDPSRNTDKFGFAQVNPSIGVDADGDYTIVWNGNGAEPHPVSPDSQNATNVDQEGVWIRSFHAADGDGSVGEWITPQRRVNMTWTGTQQFPSIGMEPDGDMIVVWSGTGVGDQSGIYGRRYNTQIDTAGPLATELRQNDVARTLIENGENVIINPPAGNPASLIVVFDEEMSQLGGVTGENSVINPNNWLLADASGTEIQNAITSVNFSFNPTYNKWEAVVNFNPAAFPDGGGGISNGLYVLIARTSLEDVNGNALARTGFLPNGTDMNLIGSDLTDPAANPPGGIGFMFRIHSTAAGSPPAGDSDPQLNAIEGMVDPTTLLVTDGIQNDPAVARRDDGSYIAVWTTEVARFDDTGAPILDINGNQVVDTDVVARMFDNTGRPIRRSDGSNVEFVVSAIDAGNQFQPDVAVDNNGNFIVVWAGDGTPMQDNAGIYAQRFDAAGDTVGGQFLVNDFRSGIQNDPAVAMDADGNFVITWTSAGQDGSLDGVFAKLYSPTAIDLTGEIQVNVNTINYQNRSDVAMSGDGRFVVTWNSYGQDGNAWGVYAQRFNAAGARLGSPFLVNQVTADKQVFPRVAMDDDGDFAITWASFLQDGNGYGVYARRYNSAGSSQGGEFRVNQTTLYDQYEPTISMDTNGDFVVAWTTFDQEDELSHDKAVFARMYNANGTDYVLQGQATPLGEFRLNATMPGNQFDADVSMDPDGHYTAVWVGPDFDDQGLPVGTGIFQRIIDPPLGTTAESDPEPVVTLSVSPSSVAEDGSGNLVYTFSRTGSTSESLTANFGVSGAAAYGSDYTVDGAATFTPTYGTVTFPAGASQVTVTVDPIADTTLETDETVELTLAAGPGYAVGGSFEATGTIQNDESHSGIVLSGSTLFVEGSAASDSVVFNKGGTVEVTVDGQLTTYPAAGITGVVFDAGDGTDSMTYNGDATNETADMWTGYAVFSGSPAVTFTWTGVESVTADLKGSGLDSDLVRMHGTDSAAREELRASLNLANFQLATGVKLTAMGYETLEAHSGLGDDAAFLWDGLGDDEFVTSPTGSTMSGPYFAPGGSVLYTFQLNTFGFVNTLAYAAYGGYDTAVIYDSAGDDELLAYRDIVAVYDKLHASNPPYDYLRKAMGFEAVESIANRGSGSFGDFANIHDSTGDDVFTASPLAGTMELDVQGGVPRRTITATGYKYTYALAANGGNDRADLTDSSEYDEVIARPDFTVLYSPDESTSDTTDNEWVLRAKGFDVTETHSLNGGVDKAVLYDSVGHDIFYVQPGYARMHSTDIWKYDNKLEGFDKVYAMSTKGGDDFAEVFGVDSVADIVTASGGDGDPNHWAQLESSLYDDLFYIRGFEDAEVHYRSSEDDVSGVDSTAAAADWLFTIDDDTL